MIIMNNNNILRSIYERMDLETERDYWQSFDNGGYAFLLETDPGSVLVEVEILGDDID